MSTTQVRIVGAAAAFLLIFLSGIWLGRSGQPYNTTIFTIHKLVGLAVGIFLAVTVYQTHKVAPLGLLAIVAIVVTVLLFAGTVVAGALLSIDEQAPAVVQRLHQVVPALTVLSTAGTLYLLLVGK